MSDTKGLSFSHLNNIFQKFQKHCVPMSPYNTTTPPFSQSNKIFSDPKT